MAHITYYRCPTARRASRVRWATQWATRFGGEAAEHYYLADAHRDLSALDAAIEHQCRAASHASCQRLELLQALGMTFGGAVALIGRAGRHL